MSKEAADSVREALAPACAPLWGTAKPDKRALLFERQGCRLRVAVEPLPGNKKRILPSWERRGDLLRAEAYMRIPLLERALEPGLSDKAYAKLPVALDAAVLPSVGGLVGSPTGKHYWRLGDLGGADTMAEELARRVEPLSALAGASPLEIAAYAAHDSSELEGTELLSSLPKPERPVPFSFIVTPSLVAALAFLLAGDLERARAAIAAFAARPDNLNASANSMTGTGLLLSTRFAIAQQLASRVGMSL